MTNVLTSQEHRLRFLFGRFDSENRTEVASLKQMDEFKHMVALYEFGKNKSPYLKEKICRLLGLQILIDELLMDSVVFSKTWVNDIVGSIKGYVPINTADLVNHVSKLEALVSSITKIYEN